jgi:PiT family inorganic phosphate transporter
MSWIISPIFSLVISYLLFKIILKLILSKENAFIWSLKLSPFFIGSTVFIVVLSFLFKTPLGKNLCIKASDASDYGIHYGIFFWIRRDEPIKTLC